jgi:hypothetical protein
MTSATEEFLTENLQRRYPFAEDAVMSHSGSDVLDDDVILDVRGWHRGSPDGRPALLAVVGPDGAGAGSFVPHAGNFTFYLTSGTDEVVWAVLLPVAAAEVATVTCRVVDPLYAQVSIGVLRVTFGAAAQGIGVDVTWLFTTAFLEPGLVVAPFRNQVDALGIIHQEGDNEVVGGDVEIIGGYSFDVFPENQGLRFAPHPGGGTLGRFTGSISGAENSKCAGALLSFGQVVPDPKSRDLRIVGKNGIEVFNFPEENRIRIKVAPQHFGGSVCP